MNKRPKTEETVTSKSSKSGSSISYFDKIDDSCLVRIFTNLSMQKKVEIEKVCHRWKKIAETKAWHNNTNLDLSFGSKIIKVEFNSNIPTQAESREIILRCGKYLKHLKLGAFYDSSILKTVRYNCSSLVTLDLDLSSYSKAHFVDVYSEMKKLESLKIKSKFYDSTFDYFHRIGDNIKNIYLDAINDSGKPPSSLYKFKSLQSITMIGFELETKTIKEICQNKNLKNLSLRYCMTKKNTDLSRITSLRSLENLDFWQIGQATTERCPTVDDDLLADISYRLKNLKYLNIGGCQNEVTVSGVNLLKRLDKLETLTISCLNLSNESGNINSNNNKLRLGPFLNLKILNCMGTRGLDDPTIIGILDNSEKLNKLIIDETEVTAHVLGRANTMTRKRANDIVLNIWVNDSVIKQFREFNSSLPPSPYLAVRTLSEDFFKNKMKNIDFTFP